MADIYFRTDGNDKIATGHVMRCLSIARACTKRGASVKFVVSDEHSLTLMQERFTAHQEFEIYCLDSDYTNLREELPLLRSLTAQDEAGTADIKPWIFIDSYYATPSYLLSLRETFRVAYLDDLRSFDCPVDLVINYDTDEDCEHYSAATRKLLGVQYTPLREQFSNTAYTVRPAVEHILLSTGGTDPYAVAEHLLTSVYHNTPCAFSNPDGTNNSEFASYSQDMQILKSIQYHILTGSTNSRYDALTSFAEKNPTVHIHENVSDVASLMASCDLAVCAGGTTLCELCAVGVPTISYLMAENQRTAVETYARSGLIPYAGDIRPHTDNKQILQTIADISPATLPPINHAALSTILSFMTYMSQNLSARTKSSQSMRAFLNGAGADQIARALIS